MTYLVVIDGAGEYRSDFTVHRVNVTTPQKAVDYLVAPENGYGQDEDGIAFVIPEKFVLPFSLNEPRRKIARPVILSSVLSDEEVDAA